MRSPAARTDAALPSTGPAALVAATLLIGLGSWLRYEHLPFHQNLWALGYYEDQARDLRSLDLFGYLLRWEGLHPPLSGVIHGGMSALGLGLPIHWAATIAATLAGPLILGLAGARRLGGSALVLTLLWVGLSPLQSNYGLNTTPYPWLLLIVGASTVGVLQILRGARGRLLLLGGLLSAAAIQIHVLALAVVVAQAIVLLVTQRKLRPGRHGEANPWWIPVGLSSTVLCWNALSMTLDSWTFHVAQASDGWFTEVTLALSSRFGAPQDKYLIIAVVGAGILGGLLRGPRVPIALLLLEAVGTLLALGLFFEVNVADPRLVHYYALPQMLLCTAGAWGTVGFARSLGTPHKQAIVVALSILLSGPWVLSTFERSQQRNEYAQEQILNSSGAEIRKIFEAAGQGDVVAYFWDNQFLNDESDHLDPVAALWPAWRLGRPCFDVDMPPHHCNAHAGSMFFFSPSAQTGRDGDRKIPFAEMEEGFRRIVNLSQPPGRTVIIVSPGPDAPPRPWPMEDWLVELGATVSPSLPGGVLVFSTPIGARAEPPPPLHH